MFRLVAVGLLALVSLTGWTTPCRADVFVRVPFFALRIGRPACGFARGVAVDVPGILHLRVRRGARPVIMPAIPPRSPRPWPLHPRRRRRSDR
jgi:hypothetical protein